jgi:hypothetical protein
LALVVGVSVWLSVFQINNDDAGFHVATGRYIRATSAVPSHNPFSYANDGATWTQHQWLPAVGISLVADAYGAKGLIIAKAAFVGLMVLVAALLAARHQLPAPVGSLALMIAVMAGAFRFKERPLLISVLAVCLTVGVLLRWRDRGLRGWRAPLAATVIPVVTLHMHAGGLYGLLVWFALAASIVASRLLPAPRFPRPKQTPDSGSTPKPEVAVATWFIATLVLAVASLWLLAPSGLGVLKLPFSFGNSAYWNAHLAEFRPLALEPWAHLQWYAVLLVAGTAALAVVTRRWFELFVLLGFGYLGVRHQRLILPMAMATVPAVASVLADVRLRPFVQKPVTRALCAGGLAMITVVGCMEQASWQRMGLGEDGFDHRRHPVELLDKAASLPANVFVSDGLAGVYLWRHFADKGAQVLVHNCLECYREQTYIESYQHIRYGKAGWREKVEKLAIKTFVIKHTSAGERRFQGGKPNVRQHLFRDPAWSLVDFNDVAALWVKSNPTNDAASGDITGYLGRYPVDPDTGRPRPGTTWPAIKTALLSHGDKHPSQTRALLILAHRAAQAGDGATLAIAVQRALKREPAAHVQEELVAVMKRFTARSGHPAP